MVWIEEGSFWKRSLTYLVRIVAAVAATWMNSSLIRLLMRRKVDTLRGSHRLFCQILRCFLSWKCLGFANKRTPSSPKALSWMLFQSSAGRSRSDIFSCFRPFFFLFSFAIGVITAVFDGAAAELFSFRHACEIRLDSRSAHEGQAASYIKTVMSETVATFIASSTRQSQPRQRLHFYNVPG